MPTEKSPLLRTTANGEQDTANGSYGHSAYSAFSDDQFLVDIDKRAELATPECGLSTVEASRRLKTYGRNEKALPEISSTRRLIAQLSHPLALLGWVVVAMELLSLRMTNALAVTTLLLMQAIPRWIQRVKAAKALAVLRATVKSEALVIRDGVHQTIDASLLVLGDRITLGAGAVVPADCRICVGGGIEVDISKLAGESFPVVLSVGDDAKQGMVVLRGEVDAVVSATGSQTFQSRTAPLAIDNTPTSHIETSVLALTVQFLLAAVGVAVAVSVSLYLQGAPGVRSVAVTAVLVLVSVPMAGPIGCTTLLLRGAFRLMEEKVFTPNVQAIERLACMDVLCTDKTGTLTRNKLELQDDLPIFYPTASREDVLVAAALAAKWKEPPRDAVDTLVLNAIDLRPLDHYTILEHMPFDPIVKRTESTIRGPTGRVFKVTKGTPLAVLSLAHNVHDIRDAVEAKVLDLARRGVRSLAVARTDEAVGGSWVFLGIITFLDPPRHDSRRMIDKAHGLGVALKMITGDQAAVAVETCRQLGMGTSVLTSTALLSACGRSGDDDITGAIVESTDGFSQLLPQHKRLVIKLLEKRGWLVGVTADSVSDISALRAASVGIATDGAPDATREVADVVVEKPGLGAIVVSVGIARDTLLLIHNHVLQHAVAAVYLLLFTAISICRIQPDDCRFRHFEPLTRNCTNDFLADSQSFERVKPFVDIPIISLVLIGLLHGVTAATLLRDKCWITPNSPVSANLKMLTATAVAQGAMGALSSFILLIWALDSWNNAGVLASYRVGELTMSQIMMVITLDVSIGLTLSVLSSRCSGFCFLEPPSTLTSVTVAASMAISSFLAFLSPFPELQAVPLKVIVFVWVYRVVWLAILEVFKVGTRTAWNTIQARGVRFKFADAVVHQLRRDLETQRQNRIGLGALYHGGESTVRDSFVAGRAVRSQEERETYHAVDSIRVAG
ncbi:hypothetical protein PINS_up002377 [Pythium insidiosum]|nr:hypothetical protein PINS_up002377 [Pythium insidiosum]